MKHLNFSLVPNVTLEMHTIKQQAMSKLNKTPTTLSMNSQAGETVKELPKFVNLKIYSPK